MFEDYKRYLTTIRNNLIQCGVEYPISPLETYRDLFQEGLKLDEVLWYYSLLAISGSDSAISGFILPLSGYYKERMRQIYYKEFLDFLEDYKKLSTTYHLLEGYTGSEELKNSYSETLDDDEVVDLFSEETMKDSTEDFIKETSSEETLVDDYSEQEEIFKDEDENSISPVDFLSLIDSSYSPASIDYSDLGNTTSHGVYLDELEYTVETQGYSEEDEEDVLDDKDSEEYVPHGVYLDELEEDDLSTEPQEVDEGYDEDDFEEPDFRNPYSEDEEYNEEDGFEEPDFENKYSEDEEDYEEYNEDDFEEPDFENHYSDDEEEYNEDDFEEPDFENHYSDDENYEEEYNEDDFEEPDFDNHYSDDDENDYEEYNEDDFEEPDFSYSYQEDEEYEEYNEDDFEEPDFDNHYSDDEEDDLDLQSWNNNNPQSQDADINNDESKRVSKPKKPTKDVSDYLQSATNSLLTAGKRFIYKETKKLKD